MPKKGSVYRKLEASGNSTYVDTSNEENYKEFESENSTVNVCILKYPVVVRFNLNSLEVNAVKFYFRMNLFKCKNCSKF